jgi:predicted amidophosphoribosyltransferase
MKRPLSKTIGLLASEKSYSDIESLYHVAYYHAARVGYQDVVSRSLHDFKDGAEPQTSRWITLAAPAVAAQLHSDVIVRALGSAEEIPSGGTPLDRLCAEIAIAGGGKYDPERLKKSRTVRPMMTIAGKALRQKELEGVYEFSAEGLTPDARVLIVDDLVTTGSTMAAIVTAVRAALPGGTIICFSLSRVEAQLHNAHLNSAYFLHGGDVTPDAHTRERLETEKASVRTIARAQHFGGASLRAPSMRAPSMTAPSMRAPSMRAPSATAPSMSATSVHSTPGGGVPPRQASRPVSGLRSPLASPVARKRGWDTRVYVVGLVLSLMVLGATALLPAKKDPEPPAQFASLVAENAVRSPDPIPERRDVSASTMSGKPAVVTVPGTGLRVSHSMESRVIPREGVRQKERVEILRRFSSQLGPDWLQVKTRSGAIGWVVASVVREVRN